MDVAMLEEKNVEKSRSTTHSPKEILTEVTVSKVCLVKT